MCIVTVSKQFPPTCKICGGVLTPQEVARGIKVCRACRDKAHEAYLDTVGWI